MAAASVMGSLGSSTLPHLHPPQHPPPRRDAGRGQFPTLPGDGRLLSSILTAHIHRAASVPPAGARAEPLADLASALAGAGASRRQPPPPDRAGDLAKSQ